LVETFWRFTFDSSVNQSDFLDEIRKHLL
jgi:hypothetical protein